MSIALLTIPATITLTFANDGNDLSIVLAWVATLPVAAIGGGFAARVFAAVS